MGKIIYSPKNKKNNNEEIVTVEEVQVSAPEQRIEGLIDNLHSVRPVGDTDCDYAVYLEDYVYTYIYQYAQTDLACEHSAAIVGEYYPETKEVVICGAIPIAKHKLANANEWVNQEALEALQEEKDKYFPGTSILGWLHMQPGYGIMLTMKEVKVQRDLFNREGNLLLLIDPINRLETFYVYEGDTLKEQSGYYIYYDKNPCMQQYMLDKPFVCQEKEEVEDAVVTQIREIGQRRKREYSQKKKTNFTVIAASIALLAMSAILLRMMEQDDRINDMANNLQVPTAVTQPVVPDQQTPPSFVFDQTSQVGDVEVAEGVVGGTVEPAVQQPEVEDNSVEVGEDTSTVDTTTDVAENDIIPEVEDVTEDAAVEESVVEEAVSEEVVVVVVEETVQVEEAEDYTTYVVESGDTIRSISVDHFNTELRTKDIIQFNELENGDHIFVGQELKIPVE